MSDETIWLIDGEELDTALAADAAYYGTLSRATKDPAERAKHEATADTIRTIRTTYLRSGRYNYAPEP